MFNEELCTRCGECFTRCHYLDYDQDEAQQQITLLIEGKPSKVLKECSTCAACNNYCPEGANPFDLILKRNEETDAMPYTKWMKNWFKPVSTVPNYVIQGDPQKPALSLCVIETGLPRGIGGPMFDGMTIIKGGDYFLWMGYIHLGQKELICDLLKKSIDNLAATGCKDIIFVHDECYTALHIMCKEFDIEVPFRYRHILHYMLEYLKSNQNKVRKLDLTVGVQIPCSGRYTLELQEVMDEIFEIIGVKRPLRRYDRENGLCCSTPIDVRQPELAAKTRALNLDDMINVGATAMVALCPICINALAADALERGLDIYMVHNLVRLALGETLPEPNIVLIDWKKYKLFLSHWRLFTLPYRIKKFFQRKSKRKVKNKKKIKSEKNK